MAPKTTLWPIGPHTPGKHLVLRSYLNAWLPIMGTRQGRLVFVDGFAGPGKYEHGEDGSPIIALRALIDHAARSRIVAEINYLFVESDADRKKHLEELVEPLRQELPRNCKVFVEQGAFDATVGELLDQIGASGQKLAPCFVMVDPFGISGTPMSLLAKILRNPKSELYVSFMYEAINRHKKSAEFEPHLDELFGTDDWRRGIDMPESAERRRFFYSLYTRQLKRAGAKYVIYFELFDGNRHVYTVFFATQHPVGCNRMKEAIWKIAPTGEYQFRGFRSATLSLALTYEPNRAGLAEEIRATFGGRQEVTMRELEEWISGDATDFHLGHLRKTLKEMELAGQLTGNGAPGKKRRPGTFPEGTLVTVAAGSSA